MDDKLKLTFLKVFSSHEGQAVLAALEQFTSHESDNFVTSDERTNAYMQGRRSVTVEIKNAIKEAQKL